MNDTSPPDLFGYRKYWAHKFTPAPFLPMSRKEMDDLGWDSCDIIIVTGDAYVDQASFGMAIVGRLLEAQGFRVGIIAQPRWQDTEDFMQLGRPNLFFGVTAGNMDSMVNRYTSDRKIRSDDAYTPDAEGGRRPDRASLVYSQRCKEAYKGIPVIIGGIEASLRRIAHYDCWQDKVRHSALVDSKADILLFGNAERAVVALAHRLANGENIRSITDLRGTAILRNVLPDDFTYIDSTDVESPGPEHGKINPYANTPAAPPQLENTAQVVTLYSRPKSLDRSKTAICLPSYEQVRSDPVLYAHASRILHLESNPGNARILVQLSLIHI